MARLHQGRRVDFRKARGLAKNDGLFVWHQGRSQTDIFSPEEWRQLPNQITVQIVRFTAVIRGDRGRRITLVTSLLDPKLYPAEQLRCQSPDLVEKELLMYLIGHNVIRCLMAEVVTRHQVDLERVSFRGTVDAARQFKEIPHGNYYWKAKPRNYRALN